MDMDGFVNEIKKQLSDNLNGVELEDDESYGIRTLYISSSRGYSGCPMGIYYTAYKSGIPIEDIVKVIAEDYKENPSA